MEEAVQIEGLNEEEETVDFFLCCICLDLIFKPVVLPCGHIACFWCVHISMRCTSSSQCPICRNSYIYFPQICQTLHFLLMKLYPATYKEREKEIMAQESKSNYFSPQFDSLRSNANFENDVRVVCETSCVKLEAEDQFFSSVSENNDALPSKRLISQEGCEYVKPVEEHLGREKTIENDTQILVSDVLCVACGQLLCCPVILNCGHAYCEACVPECDDNDLKCTICKCVHPSFPLKVCLELDHFLEERFSTEYLLRRDSTPSQKEEVNNAKTSSFWSLIHKVRKPQQSSVFIHCHVGCDTCGMYPIIGDRYKCKDCTEAIGFDVCGECYRTASKLPGRFNQRHTPDHNFVLINSSDFHLDFEHLDLVSTCPP